jgi:hypothetical protein
MKTVGARLRICEWCCSILHFPLGKREWWLTRGNFSGFSMAPRNLSKKFGIDVPPFG